MPQIPLAELERLSGKLIIHWAWVEYGLDRCVRSMFRDWGGSVYRDVLPTTLKAKLKFFRKVARDHSYFEQSRKELLRIADETARVAWERNWIVHGITTVHSGLVVDYPLTLTRLLRSDDERVEHKKVSVEDLEAVAQDCRRLTLAYAFILCEPLCVISREHVDAVLQEFGFEELPPILG